MVPLDPIAKKVRSAEFFLRAGLSLFRRLAPPSHGLRTVIMTPSPLAYMPPTSACALASPCSAKGRNSRQAVAASDRLYAATPFSKSPAIVLLAKFRKTKSTPAKAAKDHMLVGRRPPTARCLRK